MRAGQLLVSKAKVVDLTATSAIAWVCVDDRNFTLVVDGQEQTPESLGFDRQVRPIAYVMTKPNSAWMMDRALPPDEAATRFSCEGSS